MRPPVFPHLLARRGHLSRRCPTDRLTVLLFDRTRLEMLNLSQNRICSVSGLASVPSLVALNLGESESVQVGRLSASALRLIFAALDDSWAWAELP